MDEECIPRWSGSNEFLILLQRGIAILGLCVCGLHGSRLSREPPAPHAPHSNTCHFVEATQRLWQPHMAGAVQQPQGPLLVYNNPTAAAQRTRTQRENIKSGLNGAVRGATGPRMPLEASNDQEHFKKTKNYNINDFRPRIPPLGMGPRGCPY